MHVSAMVLMFVRTTIAVVVRTHLRRADRNCQAVFTLRTTSHDVVLWVTGRFVPSSVFPPGCFALYGRIQRFLVTLYILLLLF